jgi:hypothetical protein
LKNKSEIKIIIGKIGLLGLLLFLVSPTMGCRTIPPFSPVNLADPAWKVRKGQAVWKPAGSSQDIAGELLVATHSSGRSFVQFSKNPFPLVQAHLDSQGWEVHFVPQNRIARAPGNPPGQISWLALLNALNGQNPKNYRFEKISDQLWRLENLSNHESIEGFLE